MPRVQYLTTRQSVHAQRIYLTGGLIGSAPAVDVLATDNAGDAAPARRCLDLSDRTDAEPWLSPRWPFDDCRSRLVITTPDANGGRPPCGPGVSRPVTLSSGKNPLLETSTLLLVTRQCTSDGSSHSTVDIDHICTELIGNLQLKKYVSF